METKVSFKNNQIEMAGILFYPDNFDETKKQPAIIISPPAGAVKEQSPALYGVIGDGNTSLDFKICIPIPIADSFNNLPL